MALISCKECRKEISSLAAACPGCGAPIPQVNDATNKKDAPKIIIAKKKENPLLIGLGSLVALVFFIWIIGTISGRPAMPRQEQSVAAVPEPTTYPQPTTYPTPAAAPVISAIAHHYSIEENGEYGYEQGISENDQKQGVSIHPMLMVRYIGEKSGTYTVQLTDGANKGVFSCKYPCEFVKSNQYYNGELIKSENMRNNEATLLWAVLQDAQNGLMVRYGSKKFN